MSGVMDKMESTGCVVGPCECGGYGVVFNDEAEARYGLCHSPEGTRIEAVLRVERADVHIRVEKRLTGWRATLFDPEHGDLVDGGFWFTGRDGAVAKAIEAARVRGLVTLHVIEDNSKAESEAERE